MFIKVAPKSYKSVVAENFNPIDFMQVALEISPVSNLRYCSKENASFFFSVRLTVAGLSRPRILMNVVVCICFNTSMNTYNVYTWVRRIKLIIEVTVKALRAIVNAFSCTARF
jgi:hypothetical protein